MSEAIKAQTFHHTFTTSILSKLKKKKQLSGAAELKEVSKGKFEVSFLLFSELQIILKYEVSTEVDSIIIEATYRSESDEDYYYAFHEHSKILIRPDWKCLNIYETGPHIHFGKKTEYKMTCDNRISLEQFLTFIISRHQYKHLESLYGAIGQTSKKVGLTVSTPQNQISSS
jgi:hypothetical protein